MAGGVREAAVRHSRSAALWEGCGHTCMLDGSTEQGLAQGPGVEVSRGIQGCLRRSCAVQCPE